MKGTQNKAKGGIITAHNTNTQNIKIMVNRELHIKLAGYDTFIGTEWRVYDHDDVVYSNFNDYDAALKEYRKLESKKMANAN